MIYKYAVFKNIAIHSYFIFMYFREHDDVPLDTNKKLSR